MYFLPIISCLYVLKSYIKNIEREGFDERVIFFPNEINNDNLTREQIMKIQGKREMLDFYESNNTTMEDKLFEATGRGMPSIFDIFKGGLLTDWNLEFDQDELKFED